MILAFPGKYTVCYQGIWKDILQGFLFSNKEDRLMVEKFEERFADYIGTRYAVATSSGRWGLYLILTKLNLQKDDEVLIPAITHPSIPFIVREAGAKPVFVDSESDSFGLDINQLKSKISKKTKVIIATHLFGVPCNIENIAEIAKDKNIVVVEDCAHGIGVKVGGVNVGNFGKAAFFSLETTKLINTLGGGMITTNDYNLYASIKYELSSYRLPTKPEILKKILRFFVHGLYGNRITFTLAVFPFIRFLNLFDIDLIQTYKKLRRTRLGSYKIRFTGMQSVLGIKQLDAIDNRNRRVKDNISLLKERIQGLDRKFITKTPNMISVQYLFTFFIENNGIFKKLLLKRSIESENRILELCPKLFGDNGKYGNSEELHKRALQISISADLNKNDILYISNAIETVSNQLRDG
jgi:dTDP-4-amino-4,6-dideoxygalactose transaminase